MFNRYRYYIKLVIILGRLPGGVMGITVNVLFDLIHQENCIFQTITLGYHVGTMWA